MKKQIYVSLVLFFVGNILFAMSPGQEYFIIENHTEKELFIRLEFCIAKEDVIHWLQNIDVVILSITNQYKFSRSGSVLSAGQSKGIISYFPFDSIIITCPYSREKLYNDMYRLPILDKLRGIIESLVITDNDGNVVFNFDDLREEDLRIERDETRYILDIY